MKLWILLLVVGFCLAAANAKTALFSSEATDSNDEFVEQEVTIQKLFGNEHTFWSSLHGIISSYFSITHRIECYINATISLHQKVRLFYKEILSCLSDFNDYLALDKSDNIPPEIISLIKDILDLTKKANGNSTVGASYNSTASSFNELFNATVYDEHALFDSMRGFDIETFTCIYSTTLDLIREIFAFVDIINNCPNVEVCSISIS